MNPEPAKFNDTPTQTTKADVFNDNKNGESDTEEVIMDVIINHRINKSKKHRYAAVRQFIYHIHWYDLEPSHDTWELIANTPRSKFLSYHNRKRVPLPHNLDDSLNC